MAKDSKKMDKATEGLATPTKAKRSKKAIHMTIEPTDNKGFIVKHTEMHDGMATKTKHHVFAHAAEMHKHVAKTYPAKAVEPTEPEPQEPEAAPAAPAAAMGGAPMGGAPEQA